MKVVLEPISGTAEANLDRAREEIGRVLNFRGTVVGAEVAGARIIVKFVVNPKWDLAFSEKVSYLTSWITAKVKSVFKVVSVSAEDRE